MAGNQVGEFEDQRARLFGLAYRMLGSAEEAEDTVQDAYVRWQTSGAEVVNPAAWLTKVTTNLCLSRLTSAKARREQYVGRCLPEPVLTDNGAVTPNDTVELRDSVSMALLLLLERLTPVERAVFVLREAFAYSHGDIAEALSVSTANSRQLYRRATQRLQVAPPRFRPPADARRRLAERFLDAAQRGALGELEHLLAEDVVAWSDGGGKATAARRPVAGRQRVVRLFHGFATKYLAAVTLDLAEVNGEPAVLGWHGATLLGVLVIEGTGDSVTATRAVANPDKLTFLQRQVSRSRGPIGRNG